MIVTAIESQPPSRITLITASVTVGTSKRTRERGGRARTGRRGGGYSSPTSGPITISSAVISTTQTALITSPGGSMSNIR